MESHEQGLLFLHVAKYFLFLSDFKCKELYSHVRFYCILRMLFEELVRSITVNIFLQVFGGFCFFFSPRKERFFLGGTAELAASTNSWDDFRQEEVLIQ